MRRQLENGDKWINTVWYRLLNASRRGHLKEQYKCINLVLYSMSMRYIVRSEGYILRFFQGTIVLGTVVS